MDKIERIKISYNQYRWGLQILVTGFISIIIGFISYKMLINIFQLFINLEAIKFVSIIFAIIIITMYSYVIFKMFIIFYKINIRINTYGFLGKDDLYSECYLEMYEEYIKIYNKNIEHKIYWYDVKKININKNDLIFKYKKDLIVVQFGSEDEIELITKLKNKLFELKKL